MPIPKVSIIIPTFNRMGLLPETLNSVKNQSYLNWECIIINDGSTDDTGSIVQEFLSDHRFRYYQNDRTINGGAAWCRNYGLNLSEGDYIQWLDDDDILSESKIERQVEKLEKLGDPYIFATCDWDFFWPEKKREFKNIIGEEEVIDTEEFFKRISLQQTFIPPVTFLTSKKLIMKAGEWDTKLTLNDDAEYFTRILVQSHGLVSTQGCFALYREHDGVRISREKSTKSLHSLLISFELMKATLNSCKIDAKNYFRWKILKVFHNYWSQFPEILNEHSELFKNSGVNLNRAYYYKIKYKLYRFTYPTYKRLIKAR